MNILKIKKVHPDAVVPQYATPGAGCFDLCAVGDSPRTVMHTTPVLFHTGLKFEIPEGYAMLIFSRSGHGFKNDTRLSNVVGVIDSDYRGEVMVRLTRDSSITDPLVVKSGDRIAQAMLVRADQWQFEVVDDLSSTQRGEGGFGSTGQAAL